MSFEKLWQWQGPSPCESKRRSPISRAAICLFLLPTSCTSTQATFSFINTSTIPLEQTGPKFRGEKEKSMIWGDTERCQKSALKTKPKPGQARIWKAGEELLGAQNSAREGMNPHPTEKTDYSHTHTQIKYCHQFFCKVIPYSSGQPMSNKCDFPECSWIKLEVKDKFGLLISVSDLSPLITRFAAKRNSSQIMAAVQAGREEIS